MKVHQIEVGNMANFTYILVYSSFYPGPVLVPGPGDRMGQLGGSRIKPFELNVPVTEEEVAKSMFGAIL